MIILNWLPQTLSFLAAAPTGSSRLFVPAFRRSAGKIRRDLRDYVEDGGSLLAICGGYQLLGHYYDTADGRMEGLSLMDLYTEQGSPRLISNIVLKNESLPDALPYEIVGFENHGAADGLTSAATHLWAEFYMVTATTERTPAKASSTATL